MYKDCFNYIYLSDTSFITLVQEKKLSQAAGPVLAEAQNGHIRRIEERIDKVYTATVALLGGVAASVIL